MKKIIDQKDANEQIIERYKNAGDAFNKATIFYNGKEISFLEILNTYRVGVENFKHKNIRENDVDLTKQHFKDAAVESLDFLKELDDRITKSDRLAGRPHKKSYDLSKRLVVENSQPINLEEFKANFEIVLFETGRLMSQFLDERASEYNRTAMPTLPQRQDKVHVTSYDGLCNLMREMCDKFEFKEFIDASKEFKAIEKSTRIG